MPIASGFAQSDTLNQIDEQGMKQGYWIIYGRDKPEKGYPEDGKIEEGTYIDNRKHGNWIKYHQDGKTPRIIGEYKKGRPNGCYMKIYPSGITQETGCFIETKQSDSLKVYHENGQLAQEKFYNENGKEEGWTKYYFKNGQLEFERFMINGLAEGGAYRYCGNGDTMEIVTYEKGIVVNQEKRDCGIDYEFNKEKIDPLHDCKRQKYYDQNGVLTMEGCLHQGRLYDGKLYKYDHDGILLKIEIWKNGKYHSDAQVLEQECECDCSEIDEAITCDGEFRNGCLWNGKHYVYDSDGILIKIEIWKNGKYHSDGQL